MRRGEHPLHNLVMDMFPRPIRSAIVESSSRQLVTADNYWAVTAKRTLSPEYRESLGPRS